jgi:hypothetical protein
VGEESDGGAIRVQGPEGIPVGFQVGYGDLPVWLDFARECGYLTEDENKRLSAGYEELGRMLGGMIERPEAFQAQTLKRRKP